jgi:hypothetical protein
VTEPIAKPVRKCGIVLSRILAKTARKIPPWNATPANAKPHFAGRFSGRRAKIRWDGLVADQVFFLDPVIAGVERFDDLLGPVSHHSQIAADGDHLHPLFGSLQRDARFHGV